MLRAQPTTTRTEGIPTRPGSRCQLVVLRLELSVIIGQSQIHYNSNGKITTVELYFWQQNTHYFSVFLIESAQHVMLFLWIGSKNDRYFCLEVAIGPLAVTRLE